MSEMFLAFPLNLGLLDLYLHGVTGTTPLQKHVGSYNQKPLPVVAYYSHFHRSREQRVRD